MAEFLLVAQQLYQWRHHPAYPELLKSLRGDHDVQHTVLLLAMATWLLKAGNAVGIIQGEAASERVPDFFIQLTLEEQVMIEVKVPQQLRSRLDEPMTIDIAREILRRRVKKSAGQLRTEHGLLGIGALHLDDEDFETLKQGARDVLSERTWSRRLIGIVLLRAGSAILPHEAWEEEGSYLKPIGTNAFFANPSYEGDVPVTQADSENEMRDGG